MWQRHLFPPKEYHSSVPNRVSHHQYRYIHFLNLLIFWTKSRPFIFFEDTFQGLLWIQMIYEIRLAFLQNLKNSFLNGWIFWTKCSTFGFLWSHKWNLAVCKNEKIYENIFLNRWIFWTKSSKFIFCEHTFCEHTCGYRRKHLRNSFVLFFWWYKWQHLRNLFSL